MHQIGELIQAGNCEHATGVAGLIVAVGGFGIEAELGFQGGGDTDVALGVLGQRLTQRLPRAASEGLIILGHHIAEDDGGIFSIRQLPVGIGIGNSHEVAGFRLPDAIGRHLVGDAEPQIGARENHAALDDAGEFALGNGLGAGAAVVIVKGHPEVFDLVICQALKQILSIHGVLQSRSAAANRSPALSQMA